MPQTYHNAYDAPLDIAYIPTGARAYQPTDDQDAYSDISPEQPASAPASANLGSHSRIPEAASWIGVTVVFLLILAGTPFLIKPSWVGAGYIASSLGLLFVLMAIFKYRRCRSQFVATRAFFAFIAFVFMTATVIHAIYLFSIASITLIAAVGLAVAIAAWIAVISMAIAMQ